MNKLTEVAKRDIQDLFNCGITLPDGSTGHVSWAGRLEDADFLARLYNLASMTSYDHRYRNVDRDIRCHVGWGDWESNWVFTVGRFDLLHSNDEQFLRFLCEVFHPAVTRNSVEDPASPEMYMLKEIQKIIRSEGYELYETKRMANRPVFSWREVGPIHAIQQQAEALKQVFTSDYLRTQIDQMQQSVDNNPTDAIGKAKELIESCCKTILEDKNVTVDEGWEIPRLLKETMAVVDVLPAGLQNAIVEDAVKNLLGNLSQMPYQIATIRNKMGTGSMGTSNSLSWY